MAHQVRSRGSSEGWKALLLFKYTLTIGQNKLCHNSLVRLDSTWLVSLEFIFHPLLVNIPFEPQLWESVRFTPMCFERLASNLVKIVRNVFLSRFVHLRGLLWRRGGWVIPKKNQYKLNLQSKFIKIQWSAKYRHFVRTITFFGVMRTLKRIFWPETQNNIYSLSQQILLPYKDTIC